MVIMFQSSYMDPTNKLVAKRFCHFMWYQILAWPMDYTVSSAIVLQKLAITIPAQLEDACPAVVIQQANSTERVRVITKTDNFFSKMQIVLTNNHVITQAVCISAE